MKTSFAIGALACLAAGLAEAGEPLRLDAAQLDHVTAGLSITFSIDGLNGGRNVVLWNSSDYDIIVTEDGLLDIGDITGGALEGIGKTLDSVALGPTLIDFDETGRDHIIIRSSPWL